MLDFAKYLKEHFNDDIRSAEKIIKSKWDKTTDIIKEAFEGKFTNKTIALNKIKNDFINEKIAPKNIDVAFLKTNMGYVVDKINELTEGDIRIIINTDIQKGEKSKKGSTPEYSIDTMDSDDDALEFETESTKPKKSKKGKAIIGGVVNSVVGEDVENFNTDYADSKDINVTVNGTEVSVNPSQDSGLTPSIHNFDTEEEAKAFTDSLKNLFAGFNIIISGNDESATDTNNTYNKLNASSVGEEIEGVGEGDEVEDAGEEPEDAGYDELEDAGEEPEDAGEEPEDAITWGDVEDFGVDGGNDKNMFDSVTPEQLIGTLIRVDEVWYNVTDMTEDKIIVCEDSDGMSYKYDLDMIDEMECVTNGSIKSPYGPSEEEVGEPESTDVAVDEEEPEDAGEEPEDAGEEPEDAGEEPEDAGEEPEDAGEEPEDAGEEPEDSEAEEEVEEPEDAGEEPEDAGEEPEDSEAEEEVANAEDDGGNDGDSLVQQESKQYFSYANRYMEDDIYKNDDNILEGSGLTSKPSAPKKKIEKVAKPETGIKKKGPSGSYTSKASKPKINLDTVKSAPKMPKKAAPKANLTGVPSKPKKNIVNVKSPNIPIEYK